MRNRRIVVLLAVLASLSLVASACGDDDETTETGSGGQGQSQTQAQAKGTLTIAGFNFPESAILSHIYAGALRNDGYTANVRANLGSREVVAPALERGEVDLYIGYAASELEFYNSGAGEATSDPRVTTERLRSRLQPKGLTALDPSSAVDQNAFAVTQAFADEHGVTTLSELGEVCGSGLILGGPTECPDRPLCQPGLEETYGLSFDEFRELDAGGPLTKAAIQQGEVSIGLVFSSDGALAQQG